MGGNKSSYASSNDAGTVFREVANKTGAIGGHAISGVAAGLKTLDATVQAHVEGGFSHLTAKLAFYPPPASYIFRQDPRLGALQMWMLTAAEQEATVVSSPGFSAVWIDTETGSRIPAYIFEVVRARFTILYSHSNATDIGHMHDACRRLASVLHVNVMAYEYTGYGRATQRPPSELETYADVRAALGFLSLTKGIPRHRIILYGQSIGSGPTIELAAHALGPFAGVVVHSGFTSCMRLVQPSLKSTPKYDIFANIDKVGHVRCPILFIHGVADEEVPIEHAIVLNRAALDAFPPLWLDGAHHNDIEFAGRQAYIEKLLAFLTHLETTVTAPVCKIVI